MASANVLPLLDIEKATGTTQMMRGSRKVDPTTMTSRIRSRQRQITPMNKQTASADKNKIITREKRRESSNKIINEEIDPARYRNTLFHNTCTSLLENGFHESFIELFTLVEQQRIDHEKAGPAAVLLSPLVEHKPTKMHFLKSGLATAEEAKRLQDLNTVYLTQQETALHFEQEGDKWLADHFHKQSLETSRKMRGDGHRKEAEALFHVGLTYENRGELLKATEHLEEFHQLAKSHKWHTDSGESLYCIACEQLRRVYTTHAEKCDNMEETITFLKKALDIAKEGGDTYQEGLASHRLGCAYEKINDYKTAILRHKNYLDRCRYHRDEVGVCTAYNVLSQCYESLGDIEEAVKCLELYVNVAERVQSKEPLAKACSAAGIMFNTLGEYEKAVEYFHKCYSLYCELEDEVSMQSAQVHYGVAQAHCSMALFMGVYSNQSDVGIQKMVAWKGWRAPPTIEDEEDDQSTGEEAEQEEDPETEHDKESRETNAQPVEQSVNGVDRIAFPTSNNISSSDD